MIQRIKFIYFSHVWRPSWIYMSETKFIEIEMVIDTQFIEIELVGKVIFVGKKFHKIIHNSTKLFIPQNYSQKIHIP
jgi:hypothetical protein